MFYKIAETGETGESSTQKCPFIPNIEAPAEIPHLQKKSTKEVQDLMKFKNILFRKKK